MDDFRTDGERRQNVLENLRSENRTWQKLFHIVFNLFGLPLYFFLGWQLFVPELFPGAPAISYWQAVGLNLIIMFFLRRRTRELHLTHRGLY